MNGRKKLCYLVGQISPKFPITYDWREYVIEQMTGLEDQIGLINPCANAFNKKLVQDGEYAVTLEREVQVLIFCLTRIIPLCWSLILHWLI
jgi:hypothetical protein